MAFGREVLDSSTSVVLVGWHFWEDSIADNTAAAAWSTMAWTCSGGRLETDGVAVTLVWGFNMVFAGGHDGKVECAMGSTTVYLDCWTRAETCATSSSTHLLRQAFSCVTLSKAS